MRAKAISWVMIGGSGRGDHRTAAVIWTRDAIPRTPFAGSFLSQAALALLAMPVIALLHSPRPAAASATRDQRPAARRDTPHAALHAGVSRPASSPTA